MTSKLYFEDRKIRLAETLTQLEKKLKTYPPGTLIHHKDGKRIKYYHRTVSESGETMRTYIPKKDKALAVSLARKMLVQDQIYDIRNELQSIDKYLASRKQKKISNLLSSESPYIALLSDDLNWLDPDKYEQNPNHQEGLIIKGPMGQMFRSKSEAIIAFALFNHDISFKYECAHTIGNFKSYPDFTIIHPVSGKEIIWEHFGLADNKDYQDTMLRKIRNYINNGYIPGHNLIITFETKEHPIDIDYINQLISYYFQ